MLALQLLQRPLPLRLVLTRFIAATTASVVVAVLVVVVVVASTTLILVNVVNVCIEHKTTGTRYTVVLIKSEQIQKPKATTTIIITTLAVVEIMQLMRLQC